MVSEVVGQKLFPDVRALCYSAGNSGYHASGPHLHISCNVPTEGITPFIFSYGYVIGREQYDAATPASAWSPLKERVFRRRKV